MISIKGNHMVSEGVVCGVTMGCAAVSVLFGILNACLVNKIELNDANSEKKAALLSSKIDRMIEISTYMHEDTITYL